MKEKRGKQRETDKEDGKEMKKIKKQK